MKRSRCSIGHVAVQGMANLRGVGQDSSVNHVAGILCYLCTRFVPEAEQPGTSLTL